jgi:hypothetical protein
VSGSGIAVVLRFSENNHADKSGDPGASRVSARHFCQKTELSAKSTNTLQQV